MVVKNNNTHYGSASKFFHWLIFFLVLGMLIVGFIMPDIVDQGQRTQLYTIHKLTGISVLLLMLIRAIWAMSNPKPDLPISVPTWQRIAAHTIHYSLYVVLIAMPLSGWGMSTASNHSPSFFGLFSLPLPGIAESKPLTELLSQIHTASAWLIIGLVSLHILAALKHHYVNKDNVLRRMMPGYKDAQS